MGLVCINVESYSGYKADEYPTCFYLENEKFEIIEILDRWYQSDFDPEWPQADYFKVFTAQDRQFLLKHEIEKDIWYLIT
jgi:hypothetical protein